MKLEIDKYILKIIKKNTKTIEQYLGAEVAKKIMLYTIEEMNRYFSEGFGERETFITDITQHALNRFLSEKNHFPNAAENAK